MAKNCIAWDHLLEVAQRGPEGLHEALFAEVESALHVRVGGADELCHHFAVSRQGVPTEGEFAVRIVCESGVCVHRIVVLRGYFVVES